MNIFSKMEDMLNIARREGLVPSHWDINQYFLELEARDNPNESWVPESFEGFRQYASIYRVSQTYLPVQLDCGTIVIYLKRTGEIELKELPVSYYFESNIEADWNG